MERMQFYLEPELKEALEQLAERRRVSQAELIREGIRRVVREGTPAEEDPLVGIVGLGSSGERFISVEHDRYLAEEKLGGRKPR